MYATGGTAKLFNDNGVKATPVSWPDEEGANNVMDMIAEHKFDLIVNVPKNHTKRELTNGYRIRGYGGAQTSGNMILEDYLEQDARLYLIKTARLSAGQRHAHTCSSTNAASVPPTMPTAGAKSYCS